VVFADEADRARLRAFVALFLDEDHFRADDQAVEGPVENGVAMKIDFAAVRRFDESTILASEEFYHTAVFIRHMFFDLTAHVLLSAFDLAYRRVKNFPDRDQRMLALGLVAMRLVDDDLLMLRHCDAKLDLEKIAAPVPGLRPGDDDMTARDARFSRRRTCVAISDRISSDAS